MAASPTLIRPGAQRAAVYNEGLAVYLYDLAHREELRKGDGHGLVDTALDGLGGDKDKAVQALAKQAKLVAYELYQDDSVSVDVVVGEPLTPAELKSIRGVKWFPPQVAVIDLPSGALAVESPNSCAIDPEEECEEGAVVKVPPGRYALWLYRKKWSELEDEVVERLRAADAAQEVVVLTPIEQARKVPKKLPLALPYPSKKPSLSWAGRYTVKGGAFEGLITFWDFWELAWLNLDRKAFDGLGLGFGSVLDLTTGGRRFTLVFLGESIKFGVPELAAYKLCLAGGDRTLAPVAGEPELMLCQFTRRQPEYPESLGCMRIGARTAVPNSWHEKWRPAVLEVRPGRLPCGDASALGRWRRDGLKVSGEVLLRAGRYLSLNFDRAALEALGAHSGDKLVLEVGGKQHELQLFADQKALEPELFKHRMFGQMPKRLDKLADEYLACADEKRAGLREQIRRFLLEGRPLLAVPDQHWYQQDQGVLLVQPATTDWPTFGLEIQLEMDAKPGDPATLRKA